MASIDNHLNPQNRPTDYIEAKKVEDPKLKGKNLDLNKVISLNKLEAPAETNLKSRNSNELLMSSKPPESIGDNSTNLMQFLSNPKCSAKSDSKDVFNSMADLNLMREAIF